MTPRSNQSLGVHRLLLTLAITLCSLATALENYQIAHAEPSTIRATLRARASIRPTVLLLMTLQTRLKLTIR